MKRTECPNCGDLSLDNELCGLCILEEARNKYIDAATGKPRDGRTSTRIMAYLLRKTI